MSDCDWSLPRGRPPSRAASPAFGRRLVCRCQRTRRGGLAEVRPSKATAVAVAVVVLAMLLAVPGASAGRTFRAGLFDDGQFLYGNPKRGFAQARVLRAQV